ncbi:hypothetical protein IJD44_03620 [bacterium]|nr:hypothetical protein [bacterium]
MARSTTVAIKRKRYSQIMICAVVLRYFLYFYAFISFIFWLLNCFEVDWLYLFNPVFRAPILFVRKILNYYPQGVGVDFSLAIIGCISVVLGFIANCISDAFQQKLYDIEEEEERIIAQRRERNRKVSSLQSKAPEIPYAAQKTTVQENPKLLFLISPQIKKIKRKKDDLELTLKEVQDWKLRINKKLLEQISYSKPIQKGYYRKNLFLLYENFDYVDDFVYYIKPTLATISAEFKKYGVSVNFCSVLSSISNISSTLEKELDIMDIILSLKFFDEIMLTQKFKINYDNKNIQQYILKFKGEYNLSKNLTISNRQPLYMLEEKNRKGDPTK